jgi:hypothetical protein
MPPKRSCPTISWMLPSLNLTKRQFDSLNAHKARDEPASGTEYAGPSLSENVISHCRLERPVGSHRCIVCGTKPLPDGIAVLVLDHIAVLIALRPPADEAARLNRSCMHHQVLCIDFYVCGTESSLYCMRHQAI